MGERVEELRMSLAVVAKTGVRSGTGFVILTTVTTVAHNLPEKILGMGWSICPKVCQFALPCVGR